MSKSLDIFFPFLSCFFDEFSRFEYFGKGFVWFLLSYIFTGLVHAYVGCTVWDLIRGKYADTIWSGNLRSNQEVIISFHRWTPKDFTLHCNAISINVLPNEYIQAAVKDLPPMDKKPGFTNKSTLSLKRKYIF